MFLNIAFYIYLNLVHITNIKIYKFTIIINIMIVAFKIKLAFLLHYYITLYLKIKKLFVVNY